MPRIKISEDDAIDHAAKAVDSAISKINTAIHYLSAARISGVGKLRNINMELEVIYAELEDL